MYKVADIKKTGWIHLGGGMATLIAGVIAQIAVGFAYDRVLTNNLIYYVLFAVGWFIFNQLVMGTAYNKLVDDAGRAKATRLSAPVETPPVGRWGQSYLRLETGLMVIWALSVVLLQLILGQLLTLPVGGFAGGFLVGGGLGRLRFAGKVRLEEEQQNYRFFFSDTGVGPRTEVAYYTTRPDDPQATGITVGATSASALPPGVKRRASLSSAGPGSAKDKPKS